MCWKSVGCDFATFALFTRTSHRLAATMFPFAGVGFCGECGGCGLTRLTRRRAGLGFQDALG